MFKKGQVEMIGLVIVVILVALGLLLYVKLVIFRSETVKVDTAYEHAYVTNLMGALFNVKLCDQTVKVEEALVSCFKHEQVCEQEGCTYTSHEIKSIIASLGVKKYQNYSLEIKKGSESKLLLNGCKTGILISTTIRTQDQEHYTASFRVCK